MTDVDYAVVIPTVGRPTLPRLLDALADAQGPAPREIVIVDDRPHGGPLPAPPTKARVLRSGGRGPAAARNTGWRAVDAEWVAFLDDDVITGPDWPAALHADLAELPPRTAGSQARINVPLPPDRRPTDSERGTAGLANARWITADMAYRRSALERVGGFDERFPRAYREDADLALRVLDAGYDLVVGQRETSHPVRPAAWLASVKAQAGNADDALMRRLHGRRWRARAAAGSGRLPQHIVTTAAAAAALALAPFARRRPAAARAAAMAGVAWAGLTAQFALQRISAGPRTPREITDMVLTSIAIPPVACAHRLAGELRCRAHAETTDSSGDNFRKGHAFAGAGPC
jgi:glycosyltransferase involved in cell wall biosynthesis